MMQTATVTVKIYKMTTKIQLIFDSGNQWSYITEQIAAKLILPFESIEKLSVITFGTDKPKTKTVK